MNIVHRLLKKSSFSHLSNYCTDSQRHRLDLTDKNGDVSFKPCTHYLLYFFILN